MLAMNKVKRMNGAEMTLLFIGDSCAAFACLKPNQYTLLPGPCDVHVHFREPGFSCVYRY